MSGHCTLQSMWLAALLSIAAGVGVAQQASPPAQAQTAPDQTGQPETKPAQSKPDQAKQHRNKHAADASRSSVPQSKGTSRKDQRRAAKLFLEATKLYQKGQFDEAMRDYEQAAALDPASANYSLAAQVARSHAVTASIQAAAKDHLLGDPAAARAALQHALELDPQNVSVTEHLRALADENLLGQTKPLYQQIVDTLGEVPELAPDAGLHTFHLRNDGRQLIQTVCRAYGIEPLVDQSVRGSQARLDLDDATFTEAMRALNIVTDSFSVPVDAHHVLVAGDTAANRRQFMRQAMETVYLSGLTSEQMTSVGALAKNIFDAQQAVVEQNSGTLTIRAPVSTIDAFNVTLRQLLDGPSQVLLDVRLIQIAHTNERNTGAQLPQQFTAFNVYAEEQSILNANQSLVQQIISSGLAAPGDTLAILGILLASGQVSNSLFSNGIALFGGGLTLSGLSPGPATLNLNINSADTRELDQVQLRLGDDQEGTLRYGQHYPIMTSSYSSIGTNTPNIAGLTGVGSSSALSSLLSSLVGSAATIPQIQYEDLGLTLKATPRLMRSGDIALSMDMKLSSLAGPSLNGIPYLNNRAYSGVITLRDGMGVVLMGELDQQESRILSGTPGITEIPGLNDLTGNDLQKDYATLLMIITPRVINGPQGFGHTPMLHVERTH